MAEGLRESLLQNADQDAARERIRVTCIVDTVEAYEAKLRAEYITDPDITEDEAALLMFQKTEAAFNWITSEATRRMGITIFRRRPSELGDHPYVRLGWAEFRSILPPNPQSIEFNQEITYTLKPTNEAIGMVNNLRSRQGLISLQELRDARQSSWLAAVAAANKVDVPH